MKRAALIISLMLLFMQSPAQAAVFQVPSIEYPNIQSAVDAAADSNDRIVVMPGTYYTPLYDACGLPDVNGFDFAGKAIRLMAGPPGQATIDCQGRSRAFTFDDGEDANSIVEGFIITNALSTGRRGMTGMWPGRLTDPSKPKSPPMARRGENVYYNHPWDTNDVNGYGGAILCSNSSSPTIRNCMITNCVVTGPVGGRGANGRNGEWFWVDPTDPNDLLDTDDGQWGGQGGYAYGDGHGGAIACLDASSPTIENCTITNNTAMGAVGGAGGNGGNAKRNSNGKESRGGDGGDGYGSGHGGAIYCKDNSLPAIINCTFNNNTGEHGIGGLGGLKGNGDEEDPPLTDGSDGDGGGDGYGGAIYCANDLTIDIDNCTFTENSSNSNGGAVYCEPNCSLTITGDSTFSRNLAGEIPFYDEMSGQSSTGKIGDGGAIYCEPNNKLKLSDCSFVENTATRDGGAINGTEKLKGVLTNCTFRVNSAGTDPVGIPGIDGDGGAVNCGQKGRFKCTDCSFTTNSATDNGGAINYISPLGGKGGKLILTNCTIVSNTAKWGGGILAAVFTAQLTDCFVIGNTAESGGGLYWENGSDVDVNETAILNNIASGVNGTGGALYSWDTDANISNCNISNNFANESGGAISIGFSTPTIKNCLLTDNSAGTEGGAIYANYWSRPLITNCTFSNDTVSSHLGSGGAIFCDFDSDLIVTDCIFDNCNRAAIYENFTDSDVILSYSLFFGNNNGDYYDADTSSVYTGAAQINSLPEASNNIAGNPLFVSKLEVGDFYLNQASSPAVNRGSDTAANLGLDSYTTDPCETPDTGQVDIGYHYVITDPNRWYLLTASVVKDEEGKAHGTISPTSGIYYVGTIVTLTATPDTGWRVQAWTGTDDDLSTATTNTVVMYSDRTVTVDFSQPRTLIVVVGGGPGYYSTIEDALHDARDGDTIVVYPGIYRGPVISVNKSVTIRSRRPDDPATVAATIIDRTGYANPAFDFLYGAKGAVLNGFTIQNCRWRVMSGRNGNRGQDRPDGDDGFFAEGSAMRIASGISPVIKNCIFRNNSCRGGNGGNGANATNDENAGRGGWSGWARGGAIYCGVGSTLTFTNCQFINNSATGGDGGDGGNYQRNGGTANYGGNWSRAEAVHYDPFSLYGIWVEGDLWEYWEWDYAWWYWYSHFDFDYYTPPSTSYIGDYRWYSGYGGAVFCDVNSTVTFVDCTISGNGAYGGMSGEGGNRPGEDPEPEISYRIPSFGGGVYCAADSNVAFIRCTLTDNGTISDPNDPNATGYRLDPYIGHGGGVCAEDTAAVTFTDCNFSQNDAPVGGGLYCANANPTIKDCNFTSNTALQGGGLFGIAGTATITGCQFINNKAIIDPNDPNIAETLGAGGGLHFWAMDVSIIDCNISSNQADASGGGVYIGGEITSSLTNCLITNNTAGRDGGGISANIFSQPTISNCTIAYNSTTGVGFDNDYGGGFYTSYNANTLIINSILWGNIATNGSQIAIGTGFEHDPCTADVTVTYSDVQGGFTRVFVDTGCRLMPEIGEQWEAVNIDDDPCFVTGPLGDYYLSQTDANSTSYPGQDTDSNCVDAGGKLASQLGMNPYTTRTDGEFDKGRVDMGYHYPLPPTVEACRICDLLFDGIINFSDFAYFALHWLYQDCSAINDWCNGADFTFDTDVNSPDLDFFTGCWLVEDNIAPRPNPAEWEIFPHSSSLTSVNMTAKTAADDWGWDVQYFFQCYSGDCHDSDWLTFLPGQEPNYTDPCLTPGATYGYRVRTRDTRPVIPDDGTGEPGNKTEWSVIGYAIAGEDTTPPTPDPMTWEIPPFPIPPNSIAMLATTAFDASGVQYRFWNITLDVYSGWQLEPNYTDSWLDPNTTYCYRVQARDMSFDLNPTDWSEPNCATTWPPDVNQDFNAPITPIGLYHPWEYAPDYPIYYPFKSAFEVLPYQELRADGYYHIMTVAAATDDTTPVLYKFICYENSWYSSGGQGSTEPEWTLNRTYIVHVSGSAGGPKNWVWQVQTRDSVVPIPNMGYQSDYWRVDGAYLYNQTPLY